MLNYSPFQTHFDSHVSSLIARYNSGQSRERERAAKDVFSLRPENRLKVGDIVLLKNKRGSFYKSSPLFYPTFSSQSYTVEKVDKKAFPWLYSLSQISDKKRKFYGFELFKIETGHSSKNDLLPSKKGEKILVKDILLQNPSKLRSGKILPGKEKVFYVISKNDQQDRVPKETLTLFKQSLGNVLVYDKSFFTPEKQKYII